MNLNLPPRSLLPLRCWAVVAAQHPVLSYWSVLCRLPARPGTIINTRPQCLRPCGNDRLVCYYYYQSLLAMTVPLWQRPPRVTSLLSMLARDVCALVATTASRAIIINARPDDCALVAKTPLACPFYHQRSPGITAPQWHRLPHVLNHLGLVCSHNHQLKLFASPAALLPAGWHSQVLHHQSNRKLACDVSAFVARPHSCCCSYPPSQPNTQRYALDVPFPCALQFPRSLFLSDPCFQLGTTQVTYSQPFTIVNNRSLACDVHSLIAQPHVYVCMFN